MKSINNMNTLNALIRDEQMASKEYMELSKDKDVPYSLRNKLLRMSADEAAHRDTLIFYRDKLRLKKLNG